MTPSERERRIESAREAIYAEMTRKGQPRATYSDLARVVLDAADEAVPVVSEAEVEADAERLGGAKVVCPGCGRGLGDVIASILRQRGRFKAQRNEARKRAERAEAAARELERELSELRERHTKLAQGVWGHPDDWRRPSFSGEEGTGR